MLNNLLLKLNAKTRSQTSQDPQFKTNLNKKMKLSKLIAISAFITLFATQNISAKDYIQIVGSSTVYPFVTTAAETFGNKTNFKTPIVESTGTGGGIKLFCSGSSASHPDMTNASRAIKKSEIDLCLKNNVGKLIEIKLGYDGIVVANSNKSKRYSLTREQIFLALAQDVPQNGKLVPNFYQTWNQIDSSLPNKKIENVILRNSL